MIYNAQLIIPRSFINVISAVCNSIEMMRKIFFSVSDTGVLGEKMHNKFYSLFIGVQRMIFFISSPDA